MLLFLKSLEKTFSHIDIAQNFLFPVGQYHLEKEGEVGQHVDLDTSLESTGTLTFTLVKAPHSKYRDT